MTILPKPMAQPPAQLDQASLLLGVKALAELDADLARVVNSYGPPPLWAREPSFATLIHIILEQQVSLASANAAFARLLGVASPLTPERFLTLDDDVLRGVGFSRQKQRYGRHLALCLLAGDLDLDTLPDLTDDEVRQMLMQVKGIGAWTADIYLMEAFLRPDIWPVGDLALAIAAQQVKGLATRPTPDELTELAESWRPWRAVAARILWHNYLSQ
jgi:DNA-3-methyladenine glycosylase II